MNLQHHLTIKFIFIFESNIKTIRPKIQSQNQHGLWKWYTSHPNILAARFMVQLMALWQLLTILLFTYGKIKGDVCNLLPRRKDFCWDASNAKANVGIDWLWRCYQVIIRQISFDRVHDKSRLLHLCCIPLKPSNLIVKKLYLWAQCITQQSSFYWQKIRDDFHYC